MAGTRTPASVREVEGTVPSPPKRPAVRSPVPAPQLPSGTNTHSLTHRCMTTCWGHAGPSPATADANRASASILAICIDSSIVGPSPAAAQRKMQQHNPYASPHACTHTITNPATPEPKQQHTARPQTYGPPANPCQSRVRGAAHAYAAHTPTPHSPTPQPPTTHATIGNKTT